MRSGWNLLWVVSILGIPLEALADEVGTWDLDGDNYTSCDAPAAVLEALPEGQACDCDDADSERNPAAVEVPYSGKDENCDFKNDFDGDGDGYEDAAVRQQYFTDNGLEERTCGSDEHLAEPWLGCENPSAMGVDIIDCDDTEDGVHTAILSAGDEQLVKLLREDWALSQSTDKLVFLSNDEEDADYYSVDETLSDPVIVGRWNAIASSFEQDRNCVAYNMIRDAQGEDPQTCRQYLYSTPETCEPGALVDNDCSAQEEENRSPGVNTTRTCKLDIRAWAEAQLDIPNGLLMLGDYVECDQGLNEGWHFRDRRDPAGLGQVRLDNCFQEALESYPGYSPGDTPGDLGFRYGPESLGNVISAVEVRRNGVARYTVEFDDTCGFVASDFNSAADYDEAVANRCVGIGGDYFKLNTGLMALDPLAVRFSVCFDASVSSSNGGDVAALAFSNMTDFLWGVGWTENSVVIDNGFARAGYEDQDLGVGDGAGVDDRQAGYTCDVSEDNFNWVANRLDCNDTSSQVNIFALEVCDGQDNNCNGFVDEPDVNWWMTEGFDSAASGGNWYARDGDADGFGMKLDDETKVSSELILEDRDAIYYCASYLECMLGDECPGRCGPNSEGYVEGNYCFFPERAEQDCYDFDPQTYPRWGTEGSAASEAPIQRFDGKDNNCDDTIALYELDCDGDGYFPIPAGLDLDSVDPSELLTSTFTEPSEIGLTRCDEGGVEAEAPVFHCNGRTLAPFCSPEGFWVLDNHALAEVFPDRYVNGVQVLWDSSPYMLDGFDCDDQDPSIYPTANDIPDDGIDNDCDGSDSVAPPATPEAPAEDDPAPLEEDPASCGGCSQPVAPSGGLLLLGLLGAIRRRRA